MIINHNQNDQVTKSQGNQSCWLWLIINDFPQTVTWSCWLWLIIIDFPQTLSLGHVCYRTTVGEIIIDFPQILSRGHVGYG
jgi:hypothetical protein